MIPSFESRHSLGGRACPCLGGDSSSSSASDQTTNTNYSDSRSVVGIDDHSVDTALTNSGNTSTSVVDSFNTSTSSSYTSYSTDAGAVAAGSSVSIEALKQNSLNFDGLLGVADNLFAQTKKTTDANLQLAGSLSSSASQAYSDATAQATGNKSLIMVAIAVVGLVAAVFAFQK